MRPELDFRSRGMPAEVRAAVRPDPDVPDDPDQDEDIPDVNPGSNPENPGDQPAVREPGLPAEVVAEPRDMGSRRDNLLTRR